MKAVILAAGLGQRLGNLTADRPKALVPVAGKTLLAHLLDFLAHGGITECVVVSGYRADRLAAWRDAHAPHLQMVHNPDYQLGSIESLRAARTHWHGDVLLCNVDHLYHPQMLERILAPRETITAICDFDRTLVADDMKIQTDGAGRMVRIHKQLTAFNGGYIGMTVVPAAQSARYWAAVEQTRTTHGRTAPVEWVLATLAAEGTSVGVCDVSGFGWAEVDAADELPTAERFVHQMAARAA